MTRPMPKARTTGTLQEINERARERAAVMAERFPGVRFSRYVPNPLGVRQAQRDGVKGAGLPQAIFDRNAEPVAGPGPRMALLDAYRRIPKGVTGYVSLTSLQAESRMSFADIFGVVRHLLDEEPDRVRLGVNALSEPTYVRFM